MDGDVIACRLTDGARLPQPHDSFPAHHDLVSGRPAILLASDNYGVRGTKKVTRSWSTWGLLSVLQDPPRLCTYTRGRLNKLGVTLAH